LGDDLPSRPFAGQIRVAGQIRALPSRARARVVHAAADRERIAANQTDNRVQAPATRDAMEHLALEPDRQLPQAREIEDLRSVEIGPPFIEPLTERVGT